MRSAVTQFFDVLGDLAPEMRARLLFFVCGLKRLPPGGFGALQPPFTLQARSVRSLRDRHEICARDRREIRMPPRLTRSSSVMITRVTARWRTRASTRCSCHRTSRTRRYGAGCARRLSLAPIRSPTCDCACECDYEVCLLLYDCTEVLMHDMSSCIQRQAACAAGRGGSDLRWALVGAGRARPFAGLAPRVAPPPRRSKPTYVYIIINA